MVYVMFFYYDFGKFTMQNLEEIYEIDLSNCENSEGLANDVVAKLEAFKINNAYIKLKLGDLSINQSQMVFIKSLIESFGHILAYVDSNSDIVREVCVETGISTEGHKGEAVISAMEVKNSSLDDLREEFEQGFQNENETKEEIKHEVVSEINKNENETPSTKAVEVIKDENNNIEQDVQKQVIGIYRKADEKENSLEFQDEDVDFYATPTSEEVVIDNKNTIYVNQTLRNGQVLDYDGNVVIIGDCHPGSEIRATGDITVWGVLGSIAHAGVKGNKEARIRALKMNAIQLRIANCYSRRPDGGNIPFISKSSTFTPEEARIVDDSIVLYKMAQD